MAKLCGFMNCCLCLVLVSMVTTPVCDGAVHSVRQPTTKVTSRPVTESINETTVNQDNKTEVEAGFVESNNSLIKKVRFETLSTTPSLLLATTLPSLETYYLPDSWREFCSVSADEFYESKFTNRTQLTTLRCEINQTSSGIWTMRDLRRSLNRYNETGKSFAVEIHCVDQSNISLSHPMQIYNLFKISVRGCIIVDYFAEQLSLELETTPDSVRVMEFKDNVVVISVRNYIHTLKNVKYIKKEFDCTHDDTVESMSNRNISYSFLMDIDPEEIEDFSVLGEQFMADVKRIDHKCNFRHLMVLDQGNTKSRSIYHMDLMAENSFYDELLVYNFSYNYIKALDDQQLKWSTRFPKLTMFDLSHNEISDIYMFKTPLHNTDRVTTINLQYNNISTITVRDLQNFKDIPMMFIDLRNNPIDCNCSDSMTELLRYIHRGEHLRISNLVNYSYIGQLKCVWPLHVAGRMLSELSEEMVCEIEVEYFLVPLISLSVAIVVICVLMFLALRFRQEINIVLFTRFNIIVPCHARESFDSNKKYDAFVSYSSKEEEYVEKLFEDLEKPNDSGTKFKFCLHHRDFIPGKSIFENVAVSVESSRHTIILLSNHFVNSEFCMHEFKEAFRQSILEQKRHLVIILMEDVDTERLPRDIKRCIKTFTYIRRDDFLFTERLVYALSIKQKSKVVKKKRKVKSVSDIDTTSKSSKTKSSSPIEFISDPKGPKKPDSFKSKQKVNNIIANSEKGVNKSKPDLTRQQTVDIVNEDELNSNFKGIKTKTVNTDNDLNSNLKDKVTAKENEKAENTEIVKIPNEKLAVNIQATKCVNNATVNVSLGLEKKLSNEFDRSVSTDTGYGSERGSYCEKLSPDTAVDVNNYPKVNETDEDRKT